MRVAVAGPLDLGPLAEELPGARGLPAGLGAAVVTQLVQGLLAAGHEVTVVSLDRAVTGRWEARGPRLRVLLGPYRPAHRARDAFAAERRAVATLLAEARADVVHAHWTYEFALGALAAGGPTLVTAHDWAPTVLRLLPHPYRAVRLGMAATVLRRAEHLTAVSPYLARRVARWARGDVTVVANGLDVPHPRDVRTLRAAPVAVAVAHGFTRLKNTTTLLRAFALVTRRVPGARLRLAGAGHEPGGPADTWARARGLAGAVEFRGPLDHHGVLALVGDADLLVHPSREESFGMVVLEALAQGVPVVGGARSGAVPWLLDGGRAGVAADVGSPARLAGAVAGVLADPVAHARLSAAGRARAGELTRGRMVDGYLGRYRAVLGDPVRAGG